MSFFENKIMSLNEEQRGLLAKILEAGKACLRDPLDDVYQTKINLNEPLPFAGGQVIKNYIELLLISLIQCNEVVSTRSRATTSAKHGYENNIVDSIKRLLQDSVYESISIDYVLEKISFSKSYLTRLFRDYAGCSIMEYYISLKIAEAQKMISEGEFSFSQIAEMLGFGSIHYFSYMFKKKTHMTPSEYRKSVQSRAVL
jgi:YesN/AraC family two-component response regulator